MSIRICLGIFRRLLDLHRDRRGNVTVMMGFLLPPLIGTFGLGYEVANWYLITRTMQNAADSAALAAATNGTSSYDTEAKAVTAQYGFTDGVNDVTVTASNTAACPGGGANCYSVQITRTVPLFLAQVIGFTGNATLPNANQQNSSVPAQKLTSAAIATQSTISVPLCLLALGSSGAQDIVTNGNPKANMNNCSVMANTSARCNGSNLGAPYGLAHNTDSGCGIIQVSGVPTVADPYASLASSNIPTNAKSSCGGNFPQEDKHGNLASTNVWGSAWPPANAISLGNNTWVVCGDQQIGGAGTTVTVNTPTGAVLIVENGQLDLNGNTLTSASGSGLTLVFSGDNGSYTHAPTSSVNNAGTLDIAAPTSGPWSGIAVYQDPSLTSGVDITSAGNSPTWQISGAVYLPHSNVTISGAVNKASNGSNCFVMVMDEVTINGTGDILSGDTANGCAAAGLNTPSASVPSRGQLVN
jgi:Flp pilus assembly protein TadG